VQLSYFPWFTFPTCEWPLIQYVVSFAPHTDSRFPSSTHRLSLFSPSSPFSNFPFHCSVPHPCHSPFLSKDRCVSLTTQTFVPLLSPNRHETTFLSNYPLLGYFFPGPSCLSKNGARGLFPPPDPFTFSSPCTFQGMYLSWRLSTRLNESLFLSFAILDVPFFPSKFPFPGFIVFAFLSPTTIVLIFHSDAYFLNISSSSIFLTVNLLHSVFIAAALFFPFLRTKKTGQRPPFISKAIVLFANLCPSPRYRTKDPPSF